MANRQMDTGKLDVLMQDVQSLGVIRPFENLPKQYAKYWSTCIEDYRARTWISAPFLWIEFYFYWRILEATDYFESSFDAFWHKTNWESQDRICIEKIEERAGKLCSGASNLKDALDWTLIGNRADLSQVSSLSSAFSDSFFALDQRNEILAKIEQCKELTWLADNAGEELAYDLIFVAEALRQFPHIRVNFRVKPVPMFVSDARENHLIDMFANAKQWKYLGKLLTPLNNEPRFRVEAPIGDAFPEPVTLTGHVAGHYTVAKGDLWYRRIFGDRYPGAASSMSKGIASLRWVKSEAASSNHLNGASLQNFQERPILMAIA